jgi:hypothetical protein
VAPLAQEIASSSPPPEGHLLTMLGRATMVDAAIFLANHPEIDALVGERELWKWPCVIKELARRQRERSGR